jgi:hypothetical protein
MVYVDAAAFDACDFFGACNQYETLIHDVNDDAFSAGFPTELFDANSTDFNSGHILFS